ncbi:glycine dehydrogenase [Nonlabens sp. Hel1_33_55]|uniref:aminomethyl-transferring glycine dehydrogenase n=1 Tax=Nonlabens sp. Hel1_33_55 TaxID=1336802 RepID=UPI000875B61E|nr:aminomethyl-transferring glycine dehydrogenase [Nonlabens sp. Hel1_33_55]SCX97499.1 glycine dehydrogenase [Nonlabens sp. Hel1_33_55]
MNTDRFALRHIGPRRADLPEMLEKIGVEDIDQLIHETIPAGIRLKKELELDKAMSEYEFSSHINTLGNKNKQYKSFIGLGYNAAIIPAVIQRNILENPGWYTAYTPYQAEIAQGRLEALLNYQTMVTDLTGMELANASLLDESTAAAEAMTLLLSVRDRDQKKNNHVKFFVDHDVLPQTKELLKTRAIPLEIELVEGNPKEMDLDDTYYAILLQYPGASGNVVDYTAFAKECSNKGIRIAVAADILSLVLLEAPGHWGADVVVGTTQRFGIPLGYGGPHAAFFATREEFKRQIPGRIIGVTKDMDGKRALRMALQTREQHIKRDKATSNICTAQVLLAVMAGMYAVYHGPRGLKYIASKVHKHAATLADAIEKLGIYQTNENYFDTLSFKADSDAVRKVALEMELNFYYPDADTVQVSINETTSLADLNEIVSAFAKAVNKEANSITRLLKETNLGTGRQTDFLTFEVFNSYHSETELMRYIKRLERKDLALNHSMIALGSCTMKLNAAAEMLPLSDPQWGNIHPFVPLDQAAGYQEMLKKLELQLNEATGFAGTSLQPNSGAQGEFAGLMAIRAYHISRGDEHRNICLIPSSAHGTNPASAVMAGMQVVVTKALENGNIDVDDLREKAEKYKDSLSALMVTYPSTHGVYESAIKEITGLIHENGGLVYMDGANMNAQVGLTNPGNIGADVCHLNLHKTFAIPHGGGGPGVGPICVAKRLVPFLPTNPIVPTGGDQAITPISAAPFGSALACLISYGYICMLGADGLKRSTEYAIINANYIKERLKGSFECLYSGEQGRAAHEMIIDCRPFKENGIEVVDIAKRLMDYGFHAPTVSFPVAGTMMIEPTESESKTEMDRFCDAMISIRKEISECDKDEPNNLLKNAPHTMMMLTANEWDFPYTREQAAYPLDWVSLNKFWPSVRRADDAYGDRNLMCTCAPMEEYL